MRRSPQSLPLPNYHPCCSAWSLEFSAPSAHLIDSGVCPSRNLAVRCCGSKSGWSPVLQYGRCAGVSHRGPPDLPDRGRVSQAANRVGGWLGVMSNGSRKRPFQIRLLGSLQSICQAGNPLRGDDQTCVYVAGRHWVRLATTPVSKLVQPRRLVAARYGQRSDTASLVTTPLLSTPNPEIFFPVCHELKSARGRNVRAEKSARFCS